MIRRLIITVLTGTALTISVLAQSPGLRRSDPVPAEVDSMYERGLDYLAQSQTEEGSWQDAMGAEPGVVGLCLSAFLAYGEDPVYGKYSAAIRRCVDFLLASQNQANGFIGNSMYNHGFATAALAEVYGTIPDQRVAAALKSAVSLILNAQQRNPHGAWRYTPDSSDADTTVTGCQVVALIAARNAGIPVPQSAFRKANRYMTACRASDGSYGYTSPSNGRPTLAAIGSLCLSLLKETESAGYQATLNYLQSKLDYRDDQYPFYFEYYMAQALYHGSEELWTEWNEKNIRLLSVTQNRDGFWSSGKGESFATSAALLSLALNYSFLPVYER